MEETPALAIAEKWFNKTAFVDALVALIGPAVHCSSFVLCCACGGAVKNAVVCRCRGATYCSRDCAKRDEAAHASACSVRRHLAKLGDSAVSVFRRGGGGRRGQVTAVCSCAVRGR